MLHATLPPAPEMHEAMRRRDRTYDGVFFVAVRTTGVFCRPTCSAKEPRRENVEFYPSVREALLAGYRPCKRCRPMEPNGRVPAWLGNVLAEVERDPSRRWRDADLRALSIDPSRARRWFKGHYGMTFHAYQRARRLGLALGQIRHGEDLTRTAYDHGYESNSAFREAFERLFDTTPGQSRTATLMVMTRLLTPLGPMVAGATDQGVCVLEFADSRGLEKQIGRLQKLLRCKIAPGANQYIEQLGEELKRYFAGSLEEFMVPLLVPGTEFQVAAWEALRSIPYGQTRTYEQQAVALGRPTAVRAVGRANGQNPLPILIPCHRVVGSDGKLCGYGGGLWRKQFLLDHERRHSPSR